MIRSAVDAMAGAGAEVVEFEIEGLEALLRNSSLIDIEFPFDLARYLEYLEKQQVESLKKVRWGLLCCILICNCLPVFEE